MDGEAQFVSLFCFIVFGKKKKKRLIAFLDMANMRIFKKNQKHHVSETEKIPSNFSKCREGFKKHFAYNADATDFFDKIHYFTWKSQHFDWSSHGRKDPHRHHLPF